jgi:hypothetical protein
MLFLVCEHPTHTLRPRPASEKRGWQGSRVLDPQSIAWRRLPVNLGGLKDRMRDWRIAFNVPHNIAVLFLKNAGSIHKPRPVHFLEKSVQRVEDFLILGWTLIPGRHRSGRWERSQLKHRAFLSSFLTWEAVCPSESPRHSTSSSSVLWWTTPLRSATPLPAATSGSCKCYNPSVFALRLRQLGTSVTGKSQTFEDFIFRRPHETESFGWCWEPLSLATWKALSAHQHAGNCSEMMVFRLAEAVPQASTSKNLTTQIPPTKFSVVFFSCKKNSTV